MVAGKTKRKSLGAKGSCSFSGARKRHRGHCGGAPGPLGIERWLPGARKRAGENAGVFADDSEVIK